MFELLSALQDLQQSAQRVARLLATLPPLPSALPLEAPTGAVAALSLEQVALWPPAWMAPPTPEATARQGATLLPMLPQQRVLEYRPDGWPLTTFRPEVTADVLVQDFPWPQQPSHLRLVNDFDAARTDYDLGVIWEALELTDQPLFVLGELRRRCRRLILRFRPWTARDGAFLGATLNRAFAHLATDLEHRVRWRVVRPLQTYERLLAQARLRVLSRQVQSTPVEDFFRSPDVLPVLTARTWGQLPAAEALRIMCTTAVDYVVEP